MLSAWGGLVHRFRLPIVLLFALAMLACGALLVRGRHDLSTGTIEGVEYDRADKLLQRALGKHAGPTVVAMFRSETMTVDDPSFYEAMGNALAPLEGDKALASVLSPVEAPGPIGDKLVSTDRHAALAILVFAGGEREAQRDYPSVRTKIHVAPPLAVTFTGFTAFHEDLDVTLREDLLRAEMVSLPLALLVLLFVFRSAVASLLPVAVGASAVLGTVAAIHRLSLVTDMPIYTVNVASLIGLGVAIDYSLFYVSRFREELRAGADVRHATMRAMDTAGRSVLFSGFAVGIGLSALVFFPRSYLAGMGIAGAIVVAFSVVCALALLPAILAMLGPRVDAGRLPFLSAEKEGALWRKLVPRVMARPIAVLVPTLAVLVAMGIPFRRLEMGVADTSVLPPQMESRATADAIHAGFTTQSKTRMIVAIEFPSDEFTSSRANALWDFRERLRALPNVASVESIFDFDPVLEREQAIKVATLPEDLRPIDVATAMEYTFGHGVAVMNVLTDAPAQSETARELVRAIRSQRTVADGQLVVTGMTARDIDSMEFMVSHAPRAIAFIMAMTFIVLFVLLRSLVLPLKAVLMNLLSIAGSFGAMVWIFQDGHLSSVLRFEPRPIEPTLPVLLFAIVFGLSMDYEVLLLSRIREEWLATGDNVRAVTEGLEKSGRLITSAAAIMVVVFLAFALARVVLIKATGVGMALAVALDATLVRTLLVPATMRLFGPWNWWLPGPLKRLLG